MEDRLLYNPLQIEMKNKEVGRHTLNIIGEVTEDSMAESIYWLDKIVRLYELEKTPIKDRVIDVIINSYGGTVYECLGLCSAIDKYKKQGYKFRTHCLSKGMSCGFILFCMGDERIVYKYSTLMYHSVSSMAFGKVQEIKENLKETDRLDNIMMEIVLENSNIDRNKLEECKKFKIDWYIQPNEALDLGVATKLV